MNNEYRQFLIKNTNSIMQNNFENLNPPPRINGGTIKQPYLFNGINDTSHPPGYESSLPKQIYLAQQQFNSNRTIPLQKGY